MKPIAMRLVALLLAAPAVAATVPVGGPVDPRIRTVVFNPREVVTVVGQLGYQIVVSFGVGERIENISVGDSLGWQVTPNKKADLLFLKPIDRLPSTNMTVVTNLRRYNFELLTSAATARRAQTYDIRFVYPNEELAAAAAAAPEAPLSDALPPDDWNFAYSYQGSKANVPARVFDDGRATYFQWPQGVDTPAVFALQPDGKEALVDHVTRGRYLIVQQVAAQFVLRSGSEVTRVFNDALRPPEPGAAAPRRRDPEPRRKRGLFGARPAPAAAAGLPVVRAAAAADLPPPPVLAPAAPPAAVAAVVVPPPAAPPGPPPRLAALPPAPRRTTPAVIVDLGVPDSAATTDAVRGAATVADKLNANESFAARIGRTAPETVGVDRLSSTDMVVPQGTIIVAVLETALNSDLPGQVRAVVSRDVRGFDGSKVLVPRGSRLIGQYSSGVALGQSRAFVIWTRLLRSDGVSVALASAATDPLGTAGLGGKVDSHFLRRFGGAALLSVITGGIDYLVATANRGNAVNVASPAQATQLAGIALQREIDIPPTIRVAQGTPVRVFVARDLDFAATRGMQP